MNLPTNPTSSMHLNETSCSRDEYLKFLASKLPLKKSQLQRYLTQHVSHPEAAVMGTYHGNNLGDMSLGLAAQNLLKKVCISAGLQNCYHLLTSS